MTTTRWPERSTPTWVWPIEAAASGSSENDSKISSIGAPSSLSILARICAVGTFFTLACRSDSSASTGAGTRSERVEAIWPNLMNIPPQSSRNRRIRSPPSGVASDDLDVNTDPVSPLRRAIRDTSNSRPPTVKNVLILVRSDARFTLRRGRSNTSSTTLSTMVASSANPKASGMISSPVISASSRNTMVAMTRPMKLPISPAAVARRKPRRTPRIRPETKPTPSTKTIDQNISQNDKSSSMDMPSA